MNGSFTYHVSCGIRKRILKVTSKYVSAVNKALRDGFDIPPANDISLQIEDVVYFPGELVEVSVTADVDELVYDLPDLGKLTVVRGIRTVASCKE